MHKFLKFIFGIKLDMFRTVTLSIIRSFSLYTQQDQDVPDLVRKLSANLYVLLCTVKNSWWWTEELPETRRVLFQK